MKANQSFDRDDEAVSAVIGAVLVFGLMTMGFMLWSLTTLPVWVSDNEEARSDAVLFEMSQLKAGMASLSSTGASGPVSANLPLGAKEVPLLQPATSVGHLDLVPYQAGNGGSNWLANFAATETHMQGSKIAGTPAQDAATWADASDVQSIKAAKVTMSGAASAFEFRVTDGAARTATLTATFAGANADCGGSDSIEVVVATTVTLYDQAICNVPAPLTDYPLDIFNPEYSFQGAIDSLSSGWTVGTTVSAGTADLGLIYSTSTGVPTFVGTGVNSGAYTRTVASSSLVFEPVNFEHQQQLLAWEAGAVVLSEQGSGTVYSAPDFHLVKDGTTGYLSWTVVKLSGSGGIGSSGAATVTATHLGTSQQTFTSTSGGTISLETQFGTAWHRFLTAEKILSGAGTDAQVGLSGDTVTLTLGTSAITEWVVDLRIIQAAVTVS